MRARSMKTQVGLLLLALAGCGRSEAPAPAPSSATQTVLRTGAVRKLVLARRFTVAEPYVHAWRLEKPRVTGGWLFVIEVDPSMTEPHQRAMPVLCAGDQTAECVNFGQPSGNVVAIVPDPLDEASLSVWFGPPALPESVDAAWIALARAKVRKEDIATFTTAEIAAAGERGGTALAAADRAELDRAAAHLILEFAPEERELAESLLEPRPK